MEEGRWERGGGPFSTKALYQTFRDNNYFSQIFRMFAIVFLLLSNFHNCFSFSNSFNSEATEILGSVCYFVHYKIILIMIIKKYSISLFFLCSAGKMTLTDRKKTYIHTIKKTILSFSLSYISKSRWKHTNNYV